MNIAAAVPVAPGAVLVAAMTPEEARDLLARINAGVEQLRHLVRDLHDRRGWEALGYASWEACVSAEFGRSRRTMFEHLQAARVERELNSAGARTTDVSTTALVTLARGTEPEERLAIAHSVDLATIPTRALRREITQRRLERIRDRRSALLADVQPLLEEPALRRPHERPWRLYTADAMHLRGLAGYDNVDLIVTSPPYGLGIDGSDVVDNAAQATHDWRNYLCYVYEWANSLFEMAHPEHGRLCLNVPLDRSLGSREPVYADWLVALRKAGFTYESTIVWKEGNVSNHQARGSLASPNAPHAVAPVEMILVMYRGRWDLGQPQCVGDIAELDWINWLSNTWTFAGEHRHRVGHGAPFPEELPKRLIQLFSFPGALVADPFVGSGTTAVAALKLGRHFVGSDIDLDNVNLTVGRILREVDPALRGPW